MTTKLSANIRKTQMALLTEDQFNGMKQKKEKKATELH